MSKPLVVYHSRSGHTRRVAQAIARRLGGDIEEIRIVQPLGGLLGYAMCAIEAMAGLTPALRRDRRTMSGHELVVIGTPVWFWNVSSPVRSWMESHPLAGRRFAFFCTMGGSGAKGVFAAMGRLAGGEPVATLALLEREIDRDLESRIEAFVQDIKAGRAARARHAHARPAHA